MLPQMNFLYFQNKNFIFLHHSNLKIYNRKKEVSLLIYMFLLESQGNLKLASFQVPGTQRNLLILVVCSQCVIIANESSGD